MGILVRMTWLGLCVLVSLLESSTLLASTSRRLLVVEVNLFLVKLTVSAKHTGLQDLTAYQVSMVSRNSSVMVARLNLVGYSLEWVVEEGMMRLLGQADW